MRLLSGRYFKFMIKLRDFAKILLSLFLLKILRKTSLEITETLTSELFWAYLFSLQISAISISLESVFYTDSTLQKNYTLKISIFLDILCWLAYVIMKILFNHERMFIAWYLKFVTKPYWFSRIWLIKS